MTWIRIAAALGFLAVAIGAFGAHGLKDRLAETRYEAQFQTGVLYHMFHVAPLAILGLLAMRGVSGTAMLIAPYLFLAGVLLFSGSLYLLAVTGERRFGMATPVGGLLLLAGWLALALVAAGE